MMVTMEKVLGDSLTVEQKYHYYERAVQNPEGDIEFIQKEFQKYYKKKPISLREDFGGTGFLACEWVKSRLENYSWAIDLDHEPIGYGMKHHYAKLSEEQQARVKYLEANVMEDHPFKADVIGAFNFSYFIFKDRAKLLQYFKAAKEGLSENGMFVLDIFGGAECYMPQIEETEHDDFSYFWDLDKYNPINNECLYYIHFQIYENGQRYEKVFTYDWRMWSVQEVKELLIEAGFSEVKIYWEGDDEEGGGDGEFYEETEVENCASWVSYIVAFS